VNQPAQKYSETTRTESRKTLVARNFEEIEAIRAIWERIQRNEPYPVPDADIDRYLSVVKASGGDTRPYVMLVEADDRAQAMIVGWIEKRQINLKLGYKTLCRPALKCLSVVYGGVLGQPEDGLCALLVSELMKQLRRPDVDMVYFNHLRTDTSFYQAVRKTPSFLTRGHFPRIEEHWIMNIPSSIDQFYQTLSAKHRSTLRRKVRMLQTKYPDEVNVVKYTQGADLEEAIKAASKVSRTTYQHALGSGLGDDSASRNVLSTAAANGWLDLSVLYVGKEPCAFQLGLRYGGRYFLQTLGFNPEWRKLSVGTVLFLRVLEDLCNDPELESFDFGFGDAPYKRRYGDRQWPEASVYIFALRPYPVFINVPRSSVEALDLGLKYVVNKMGLVRWIKRRWRQRLVRFH